MRKLSSYIAGQQHDMTIYPKAKSTRALLILGALSSTFILAPAWAQKFPISAEQRNTANTVSQTGVALSDLAPNAPDKYTVKTGDTLWAIATLYLKSPWRWPELWGMNIQAVQNPHLIYPGQVLVLERSGDRARLRMGSGDGDGDTSASDTNTNNTVLHLLPKTRLTRLGDGPLQTLNPADIEPFLTEPLIVDKEEFEAAPHIVSGTEGRIVMASGDRAYARGPQNAPVLFEGSGAKRFRIYSAATPLLDPDTKKVLGYEAKFAGTAELAKEEVRTSATDADGKAVESVVAAAIDITSSTLDINTGDRLIPTHALQINNYVPHAPAASVQSRIVSVYGTAVTNAAQNQVVAITGGTAEGMDVGTVLAILKNGVVLPPERENPDGPEVRLPNERVGLLMVFRTFEHLSYGLILEIVDGVRIGDRLVSP